MTMTDEERAILVKALGAEPEKVAAPAVKQDGKVDETTEDESWVRPSDEEVKRQEAVLRHIETTYTMKDDKGEVVFDVAKIASEQGFNLAAKDETPTAPKDEPVTTDEKDLVKMLKDDPKALIEHLRTQVRGDVKKEILEEVQPYMQRSDNDRTQTFLNNVRAKFSDFEDIKGEVGKYLANKKPQINTQEDLEDVYHTVKGRLGQEASPPAPAGTSTLAGTGGTRGAPRSSSPDTRTDTDREADDAIERMLVAGQKPSNNDEAETMDILFGKKSLSPIAED